MDLLQANGMSRSLKALCDVNRIRILEILVRGEFCVSDLVEQLQIDQPKVSHHLANLRRASIIRNRREGRHINYSIRPSVYTPPADPEQDDVFDLGDISVAFRFNRDGEATAHASEELPVNPPPAELEAGGGH